MVILSGEEFKTLAKYLIVCVNGMLLPEGSRLVILYRVGRFLILSVSPTAGLSSGSFSKFDRNC